MNEPPGEESSGLRSRAHSLNSYQGIDQPQLIWKAREVESFHEAGSSLSAEIKQSKCVA